jgi:hypothetical protein
MLDPDEVKKAQGSIVELYQKVKIAAALLLAANVRSENPQRAYAESPLQFRPMNSKRRDDLI